MSPFVSEMQLFMKVIFEEKLNASFHSLSMSVIQNSYLLAISLTRLCVKAIICSYEVFENRDIRCCLVAGGI